MNPHCEHCDTAYDNTRDTISADDAAPFVCQPCIDTYHAEHELIARQRAARTQEARHE